MSAINELKKQVEDYIEKYVDIPKVEELDEEDMSLFGLSSATNEQLKEYLEFYGAYKSYLESKLAIIESNMGMLRSMLDNKMDRKMDLLSREAAKRVTKDFARGRAMNEDEEIQNLSNEVNLLSAIFTRVRGMKDSYTTAYNTVSRMVTLKENSKEQIF